MNRGQSRGQSRWLVRGHHVLKLSNLSITDNPSWAVALSVAILMAESTRPKRAWT
ncbi:hypothetical protein CsSME_00007777 [Camellia sinensis var. sinensis]